jgi:hypothetical protein
MPVTTEVRERLRIALHKQLRKKLRKETRKQRIARHQATYIVVDGDVHFIN